MFVLGLLLGLLLGVSAGLAAQACGAAHRQGEHVYIGRWDLGGGAVAYAVAFVGFMLLLPFCVVHDDLFPRARPWLGIREDDS